MSLAARVKLYDQIERNRGRPLVVYVTSKRPGAEAEMATDALPFLIEQLDALPRSEGMDLLIASFGGDPMVAWRIMSLIRERVKHVAVLVPQSAYSAATLLALGANEIVMHRNGHLGPVDMQIRTGARLFSTEDISAFLDFVREKLSITDQQHLRKLFAAMCSDVGPITIGFTARSTKLASLLGERLLGMHYPDDQDGSKSRSMVNTMSREFYSHAYPVSRSEAVKIGLSVKQDVSEELERLIWDVWLDLEEELKERQPTSPLIELLNSPEASKLLEPIPVLNMPFNAPGPNYVQANLQDVASAAATKIAPVDWEHVAALMESKRVAFRGVSRGKILASRTPDLTIQFNPLTSFRGWEQVNIPG